MSLLGSLDIINAFNVQRDDEDYDDFTQRIDIGTREVDAAINALHLAGYDVAASDRGNHRRKYKLIHADTRASAEALANDPVSDNDDPAVICLSASSGKENNKRSKTTKTTVKKTARMEGGNKLAPKFDAYQDSEDPLVRELSMKLASTEHQLLELQTLFKREFIFYVTTLFTLVHTLILYCHSYRAKVIVGFSPEGGYGGGEE